MKFKIRPFVGVGNAEFGMTPLEIEAVLGPSISVKTTNRGEREEIRENIAVRYGDRGVIEFAFLPEADLGIDDFDLFGAPDPVGVLLGYDPSPKECFGFLIFLKIGVAITGYHDGDESQRAITTFQPGRWDSMAEHFAEFLRVPGF